MYNLFILCLSFLALLWSANKLVVGAWGLANYYQLPPLLVGFTLVALGASGPEIIIAIQASMDGLNDLAISNTMGSNIANIGLILGILALIRPLKVPSTFLKREFPLLFMAMIFIYSLMLDGYLGVIDSCLSLLVCLLFIGYLLYTSRPSTMEKQVADRFRKVAFLQHSVKYYTISVFIGFIVLPISAKFLVKISSVLAQTLGISELVIGLTIVAIGSSLPEMITAILAVRKGADDIAIGTILGSNLFNLVAVMIFPGLIHPSPISYAILWRDMPVMFLTTIILLWINTRHKKVITRWHGGFLILVYCSYILSLIISALR